MTGTERSAEWLKAGGLRPTRQRLALAGLLVGDGQNRHVTAESLYVQCSGTAEKVSLATVYNTLRAFCDAGLLHEIVVDGARSYFDTRLDDEMERARLRRVFTQGLDQVVGYVLPLAREEFELLPLVKGLIDDRAGD